MEQLAHLEPLVMMEHLLSHAIARINTPDTLYCIIYTQHNEQIFSNECLYTVLNRNGIINFVD